MVFFDFESTKDTMAQCTVDTPRTPATSANRIPRVCPAVNARIVPIRGAVGNSTSPTTSSPRPCVTTVWMRNWRKAPNVFAAVHDARSATRGIQKLAIYIKTYCAGTCGFRQVQFQGDDTLTDFGRWLFNPRHRGCTALAHNMKVSYIKLVAFSLRVCASLVNIVLIRFVIYFFLVP